MSLPDEAIKKGWREIGYLTDDSAPELLSSFTPLRERYELPRPSPIFGIPVITSDLLPADRVYLLGGPGGTYMVRPSPAARRRAIAERLATVMRKDRARRASRDACRVIRRIMFWRALLTGSPAHH